MDQLGIVADRFQQRLTKSNRLEEPSLSVPDLPSRVAKCVRSLAGCYRRDDAADPSVYAAALIAVLSEYPIDVVEHVTDPRTGLPRTLKWLPSVAEVVEA